MLRLKSRAGFALPMAILVIAILTAALAAGLAATTAESTVSGARRGQNRAYVIAQSGLEQYLSPSGRTRLCAQTSSKCITDLALKRVVSGTIVTDTERVRVSMAGGFADVMSIRIRDSATVGTTLVPPLYFVRARGVDTNRIRLAGGIRDTAERTVGVYATYPTNVVTIKAAILSLTGLHKSGSAGKIDGNDACGKKSAVAGITTPTGEYSVSGNFTPTGSPPLDTSSTQGELQDAVGINWDQIKNANAIPADFTVPPNSFPSYSWFAADTNRWPIIHVTSDFSLPNKGRGLLIVDGNFSISGSNMWSGVILVGGSLTSNGNNTMSGATISGLNTTLGQTVDTATVTTYLDDLNGNKTYVYNSCSVDGAVNGMKGFRAIKNTWMDNVASW